MNTPTHIIVGAGLFARPGQNRVILAAFAGGLLPDLSLLLLVGWYRYVLRVPDQQVFGVMYFSEEWQDIFAIDNSFFLWGGLIAFGLWRAMPWLVALAGAGAVHVVSDFLLHNTDARRHFWPVSDWVFNSPVSYWDSAHYGNIVAPIEFTLLLVVSALLLVRLKQIWTRLLVIALASIQVVPVLMTGGFHGLH